MLLRKRSSKSPGVILKAGVVLTSNKPEGYAYNVEGKRGLNATGISMEIRTRIPLINGKAINLFISLISLTPNFVNFYITVILSLDLLEYKIFGNSAIYLYSFLLLELNNKKKSGDGRIFTFNRIGQWF